MSRKISGSFVENFFISLTICSIALVVLLCMKLDISISQAIGFALLGSFCYALAETQFAKRKK